MKKNEAMKKQAMQTLSESSPVTPLIPIPGQAITKRVHDLIEKHHSEDVAILEQGTAALPEKSAWILSAWAGSLIALSYKSVPRWQEATAEIKAKAGASDDLRSRGGQATERHMRLLLRLVLKGLRRVQLAQNTMP